MATYHRPLKLFIKKGVNVKVECRKCNHSAVFDPRELAWFADENLDPYQLRLRCTKCGSRNFRTSAEFTKPPTR